MTLVGEKLRQERQKQGLDLRQIATRLCINSSYLTAIEADDWDRLPGGFFSRSFVRQYAAHLRMDAAQFDEALDAALGAEQVVDLKLLATPRITINVPPMPTASHRTFDKRMMISIGALVTVVLGCSGLYAVWQRSKDKQAPAETRIIRQQAGKNQADGRAEFSPKPVIPAAINRNSPAPSTAASQPAGVFSASTSPSATGLQVAASETTWLEVVMNGKMVFMGVLEPGQSRDLQNAEAARILVGNAGGVAMRWNGKDIGPIGPRGQVRRVVFNKESYEIQYPGKPASD